MFEDAERQRFHDCELVVLHDTRHYQSELLKLQEDLLALATAARGWGDDHLAHMRDVFKITPFYNATSLVLAFVNAKLVGTAGVDTDIAADLADRHVVHLCSVNLERSLRNSGLVAHLFVMLARHVLSQLPADHDVYFTSISQSPMVYSIMAKIAPLYPDGENPPPPHVLDIAQRVVAKYDAHLTLEPDTLILRRECDFFYHDVPYVADQRVNALFDRLLDIPGGDVFVNVGRTNVAAAITRIERYERRSKALAGGQSHAELPH